MLACALIGVCVVIRLNTVYFNEVNLYKGKDS